MAHCSFSQAQRYYEWERDREAAEDEEYEERLREARKEAELERRIERLEGRQRRGYDD